VVEPLWYGSSATPRRCVEVAQMPDPQDLWVSPMMPAMLVLLGAVLLVEMGVV